MSVQHRRHVGWEVCCDARGCPATTGSTPKSTHSEDAATAAARALLWVAVTIAGRTYWVCPMQQIRDPRLGRWVPQPGCIRVASWRGRDTRAQSTHRPGRSSPDDR